VLVKTALVMRVASKASNDDASAIVLDDQARATLDRIAYAIIGSDRETILPVESQPLWSDFVRYRVSLGVQDGELVWDDPERIGLSGDDQVVWSANPDLPGERSVVWSRLVGGLLEGELPNGVDDNGNGLVDEEGLSFVVGGDQVEILLTLERVLHDGTRVTRTVQTTVTCRNAHR